MSDGNGASLGMPFFEFNGKPFTSAEAKIRKFGDIPDLITMDITPPEYLVPALGVARNTLALWTGGDGEGKTYLAERMAIAVSRGELFLGARCQQSPVLYIDHENPSFAVQERLHTMGQEESNPQLRFWGTWCEQQPPQAGGELLLTIAKETRPLIVIDPFRYFHNGEENDSGAMAAVMQYLRACAVYGSAVVILHHPAKGVGSTGRGSGAIHQACDLAFLHTFDRESGLITLAVDKNRFGPRRTFSVRADFGSGSFEITEAPYITERNDEIRKLSAIIAADPGLSQNLICERSQMMKTRAMQFLNEGKGTHWEVRTGKNRTKNYFPLEWFSKLQNHLEPLEPPPYSSGGSVVLSPLGENHQNHLSIEPPSSGSQISERLCSVHGFHTAWFRPSSGIWVCLQCHPGGIQ